MKIVISIGFSVAKDVRKSETGSDHCSWAGEPPKSNEGYLQSAKAEAHTARSHRLGSPQCNHGLERLLEEDSQNSVTSAGKLISRTVPPVAA